MKNTIIIVLLLFCTKLSIGNIYANELINIELYGLADTTKSKNKTKDKEEIIKKGISFGPLPVVAFDQDKGFNTELCSIFIILATVRGIQTLNRSGILKLRHIQKDLISLILDTTIKP